MVASEHAGAAFAKGKRLIVVALGLPENKEDEANDEDGGQEDANDVEPVAPTAGLFVGDGRLAVLVIFLANTVGA